MAEKGHCSRMRLTKYDVAQMLFALVQVQTFEKRIYMLYRMAM